MEIVKKPWGYEKWIIQGEKFVVKEIFMEAGARSSLQYHRVKAETNYIQSGTALVRLGEDEEYMLPGTIFHVAPWCIHRVNAVKDLTMIEISSPELDDIVRLEDDFKRPDGRIESEHT